MIVAAKYTFKIRIEEIYSLKEKRALLSRLKTHLKNNFECCTVESGFQDSLRYIEMTAVFLGFGENEVRKTKERMSEAAELLCDGTLESEEFECI